ncbi:hypothetical protein [Plantactinospora mayteni]|nr:hypothetical protein [Plantactinospora mayteni]
MVMMKLGDETTAEVHGTGWHLEVFEERLPLPEIIRRRVCQELVGG